MPWRHCIFTDTGVVFSPCPTFKTQTSRACGSGRGTHLKDQLSSDILESLEQIELTDDTASAATTPIAARDAHPASPLPWAVDRSPLRARLAPGPVKRLRTSFTLLRRSPEPQEEALANNAEQGKDRFSQRATSLATLGHNAPSSPCNSTIWRFATTFARRGQRVPTKLESPLSAAALCHGSHSKPTSRLDSSSRAPLAPTLTLSPDLPWKVMGRRWKTAKFVQAHNELAARRGALLATITPPPRTKCSILALQEHFRTQS